MVAVMEKRLTKEEMVSLGSRLRQAREDAKFSRQKLADLTGVSARVIEHTEVANSEPSLKDLKRLCDALGLDLADVMAEIDPATAPAPGTKAKPKAPPSLAAGPQSVTIDGKVYQLVPLGRAPSEVLQDLADLVEAKGVTGRALPTRITGAKDALSQLDYDELLGIAEDFDVSTDDGPAAKDVTDLDVEETDASCQALSGRIVFAAVYPDFETLTTEALARVASEVNKRLGGGWADDPIQADRDALLGLGESEEEYRARLLRELPDLLFTAIAKRQPIDVSDEDEYPRETPEPDGDE